MKINVIGGTMPQEEINEYVKYIEEKNPGRTISSIDLKIDGDYVDMDYKFESIPFERIRRITGYLVGTVDRFNNAKRSEEHDRIKHDINCCAVDSF